MGSYRSIDVILFEKALVLKNSKLQALLCRLCRLSQMTPSVLPLGAWSLREPHGQTLRSVCVVSVCVCACHTVYCAIQDTSLSNTPGVV